MILRRHLHRVTPGVALVVALACSGLGQHAAQCDEPDSIVWRDDYGNALEEARAANRFLWIQFTGPWCPPTAPGWNATRSLTQRSSGTHDNRSCP